jgi:hypothetical protein
LSQTPYIAQNSVTMPELNEHSVGCPYCGETISVLVDDSLPVQRYIEDCEVCCRPIMLDVMVAPDGDIAVNARGENESV